MCPHVGLHYGMQYAAINLLGSELAEYLLYDITVLKAIPDVSKSELFQSRNVVLSGIRVSSRRNGRLETLSASR